MEKGEPFSILPSMAKCTFEQLARTGITFLSVELRTITSDLEQMELKVFKVRHTLKAWRQIFYMQHGPLFIGEIEQRLFYFSAYS